MSYEALLYYGTLAVVMICWVAFAAAFLINRKPKSASVERKRDRKAFVGIFVVSIGYFFVWRFHRVDAYLLPDWGSIPAAIFSITAIFIAVCSAWLTVSAVKALGANWAVAARVVEGHQLVTSGPYSRVRNPIYTAMFGMLVATGLAVSQWWAILAGMALFLVGTRIRIHAEEHLLRETFGTGFDEYAARVPALFPKLF